MVDVVEFNLKCFHGLSFREAFRALLFDKGEVTRAIYSASEAASVFDWSFEGICAYFTKPSTSCWPVVTDLRSLVRTHEKRVLPEWLGEQDLLHILELGKTQRSDEEKLATKLIFEAYLTLLSALQNGELIARGRESALSQTVEVPSSLWSSEFTFLSLRKNQLLRVDGDDGKVLAEDLTLFSAQPSNDKRKSGCDAGEEGRFVEADVIRLLKSLDELPRKSKASIKKETLSRFSGLSGRHFDQLWALYAPKRFTQRGRIPSKQSGT